jgi:hypothetical protein
MKKHLWITIALLAFKVSAAQDSLSFNPKRNELNIGYFDAFNLRYVHDLGIGYKYPLRTGAIRIGAAIRYNYSAANNSKSPDATNKLLVIRPRLGYEFRQNYNRFVVFYGIDFSGYTSKNISIYEFSRYESRVRGLGISPFTGLKYFINGKISVSTEINFDFMYQKSEDTYSDGISVEVRTYKKINVELSPLGILSINYHF